QYNTWLFNSYMLVELVMTSGAGIFLIPNKKIHKYIYTAIAGVTIIWISQISKFGFHAMATWALVSTCVLLIAVYFVVLFYLGYYTKNKLFLQPAFWLGISVILYFGCVLPVFGLQNYIYDRYPELAAKFW